MSVLRVLHAATRRIARLFASVSAGHGRRVAAFAGLLLAAHVLAQQPSENLALMNALSQRFRSLEQGLAEGDLQRTKSIAADLRALLDEHLISPPPELARAQDAFAEQVARLDRDAAEVVELSGAGNLPGAGQAFEELRASCVSCHVRFRSNNEQRGLFPARDNTLVGTVDLVDADGEPRADRSWVLAFLEGPRAGPPYVHARKNPRVTQSQRRFEPRVLPVVVGSVVEFPNDDTIFHNVFSLSKAAPFDLGVYEPGQSASVRMTRTGLVKVYCNIHPDMASSIVVLDNPWFALTDASGSFVICSVPDGSYVLRLWNDMGAEGRQPLEIRGGRLVRARVALRETRRTLLHNDKHGKPYPSKYR